MTKRIISVLMIVVSLLSLMCFASSVSAAELVDSTQRFVDVKPGKWYTESVDYAVTHGLFSGMSDTTFEPDTPMSRAMFVSVLARIDGDTTSKKVSTKFTDVPSGKWYTGAVKWASDNGVVYGVTDTTFEPDTSITREQMCTILVRYAEFKGITLKNANRITSFDDDSDISKWAKSAVYACRHAGIISGMTANTFAPKQTATRAQVARILSVFHQDYIAVMPDEPMTPGDDDAAEPTPPAEDEETVIRPVALDKYSFDENPLTNWRNETNHEVLPSFAIDDTGFVRDGTKLSDLNGATLQFFTADSKALWSYRDANGEIINEWQWFKLLKSELGLNIKYTIKRSADSVQSALLYMRSGKQCDIVYTNNDIMLKAFAVSRPLTDAANMDNISYSYGICEKTMAAYMWANSPRIIAPIANVDVLWYNRTMAQELGLSDPYTMWQQGDWDWDAFRDFQLSVPNVNSDGKELVSFSQILNSVPTRWAPTNGKNVLSILGDSAVASVQNNWQDPQVLEALEFIADVNGSVGYDSVNSNISYYGLYDGTTMMSATTYPHNYVDTGYSKQILIQWVPYPKADTVTGVNSCVNLGIGMMLPKTTSREDNVGIALKFMELWAARYTEATFNALYTFDYYNYNMDQRREYFNYATGNAVAALDLYYSGTDIYKALAGDASYDVVTEIINNADIINSTILQELKFGL